MKKVAKTLRSHRELIPNYFRAKKQFSSGVVEGLNDKAKLTMRKAYGFRTGFRTFDIIESLSTMRLANYRSQTLPTDLLTNPHEIHPRFHRSFRIYHGRQRRCHRSVRQSASELPARSARYELCSEHSK